MKSQLCGGMGLILVLVATGMASGQDCGCGSAPEGGHRHFWPGPYGGPNCGREYNQSQAEALWAGYCTENCSLCGRGCGGACGSQGACGCGPFGGFAHSGGNQGGHLFSRLGHGAHAGGACEGGGKAYGRSSFGCSQWGWGNCGQGCGCSDCGTGANRTGCQHLGHVGRKGRYFHPASCPGGCDQNAEVAAPPHASSVPTDFHRYQSGENQLNRPGSSLPGNQFPGSQSPSGAGTLPASGYFGS